jgi:hypothetical protein
VEHKREASSVKMHLILPLQIISVMQQPSQLLIIAVIPNPVMMVEPIHEVVVDPITAEMEFSDLPKNVMMETIVMEMAVIVTVTKNFQTNQAYLAIPTASSSTLSKK